AFSECDNFGFPGFVGVGKGALLLSLDGLQLGGRLTQGRARAQMTDHPQQTRVASVDLRRGEAERNPGFGRKGEGKTLVHDADYSVRQAIDLDGLAKDVGIGTVAALPQTVAQDDLVVFAELFLLREKGAASDRSHAQNVEEVGADSKRLYLLRLGVASKVDLVPVVGG